MAHLKCLRCRSRVWRDGPADGRADELCPGCGDPLETVAEPGSTDPGRRAADDAWRRGVMAVCVTPCDVGVGDCGVCDACADALWPVGAVAVLGPWRGEGFARLRGRVAGGQAAVGSARMRLSALM